MKLTKEELASLERLTKQYLKLMKQGEFNDARLISGLMEHATYTLDAVWLKGYEARQGVRS